MSLFRLSFFVGFVAIASFFTACREQPFDIFRPQPPAKNTASPTGKFEQLPPERTGITFVPTIEEDYRYNFSMDPYIYNGGGVAVLDFDNDGLQDIFFTNRLQGCRLYRNLGGLKFEDVSEKSGVAKHGGLKTGATTVDINADGWMDIYVCRTWLEPLEERRNMLLVNNHDGTFTDQAKAYGLDDIAASQHANFFDYDLDGDLDCYVMNHPVDFRSISQLDFVPSATAKSARNQPPRNEYESDRLYRNDAPPSGGGGGKFTDISKSAGIHNRAFGLSVTATDFNSDGYPDLFIGNDFLMPDFALINSPRTGGQGGAGRTFSDQAEAMFRHTSNQTMGVDVADLNRDGLLDLVAIDMLADPWTRRKRLMANIFNERDKKMAALGYGRQAMRNTLQLNNGGRRTVDGGQSSVSLPLTGGQGGLPTFSEIGCLAGMFATDWSWSPLAADFDHDGHCDLFISNGIKRDLNDMDFFLYTADSINHTGGVSNKRFPNFEKYADLMPSVPVHNYLFQNTGYLQFTDVSEAWGFGQTSFSNGAAYADLDNDGDLDLITNNLESPAGIFENKATTHNQNHWLQIRLAGPAQNPMGLGAKVRVWADGQLAFAGEMANVRGFYSSSEPVWQIGLGAAAKAEKIELEWLGGRVQILENVRANQRLTMRITDTKPGKLPLLAPVQPLVFEEKTATNGLDFRHIENPFEDFDRERLLPKRLSTPGPCLAVGDADGDGLDDVFIGGATGQAGAIFRQKQDGSFAKTAQPDLEKTAEHEDAAALFFDADGDGDPDLYVGSGGNEQPSGSKTYQDRLFKNDGQGNFSLDAAALPAETESAACVRAHDFDGDGDLDLFVGSRVVPGRWPLAPRSLVLKNEGGKFMDATASAAPDFEKCGMVTDLKFADLDGDSRAEMVVVGEWMAVSVFKWDGQQFKNETAQCGLENSTGWWNCLEISDLDGDGDLDLVVGNEGQNTRLRASVGAPLRVFAKDFDGNGSIDPIVAVPDGEVYRPLAPRDVLGLQMAGFVKKKFPRHGPYAAATITDLFPEKELLAGLCLDAKTFDNQWFESLGNGKFAAHSLPLETQFAPVRRILAADFTGDGKLDLLTVGNDFGRDPETFRLDASNGCLLVGDGRGHFRAVPAQQSGLWADKEARDAVLLTKTADGRRRVVVGNCDDAVQVFTFD